MSYHTPWADAHSTALAHHVLGGRLSYSGIAAALNDEFNTSYSRNSCIGKAGRLGLINPYWQKLATMVKKPRKPQAYKPRPKRPEAEYRERQLQLRCQEVRPDQVSLVDLCADGCRWPYGDSPYTFCNQTQLEGASYCPTHRASSVRWHEAILDRANHHHPAPAGGRGQINGSRWS